jgi:predicted AAA+ superfamily ATPase
MNKISIPQNFIRREAYLSRIKPFIEKNIIKVLTGQRRVGKSYILFQLITSFQENNPNASIIYINKEDLSFDFIKTAADLNKYVLENLKENQMNYVLIDEIQEINEFEKALRSLLLIENIDIYCTGSNATLLSGELASLLSGRYIEFSIYSLSYIEFLEFHKLEEHEDSLEKYIKYGGLPYLYNLELVGEVVFEYLKSVYSTIVYRDVITRYNIRNIRLLEKLVQFLADNIGSIFSAKSISDFLKSQQVKLSPNQIQVFVEYLCNSFLIHRVERYDIKGKRIFETGEKYYFENLGIRNAVIGYKPDDRGKLLENLVFNQLLFKGFSINTGSLNSKEIDFVCEKDGEKSYIQVALQLGNESTIKREFGNLLDINDNYPKTVITMDNFSGNSYQGIKHVNIKDFLNI